MTNMYLVVFLTLLAFSFGSEEVINTLPSGSGGFTFKKVFFVLLENQPIHVAMDDPAMSALASRGTLLTNLEAVVNPSQPNYIALIAGDTMGVKNDANYDVSGRCLVDTMEEHNITWKAYQENYPSVCFTGNTEDGLYKRKHNPFISFAQVRENATVCSKIVNADQLYEDIKSDSMPQYSFYTPNMDNNGHDTNMRYAAAWLEGFLIPLLSEPNFMKDMLVVVTFDEGVRGDNIIYTVLLGNDIPSGHIDSTSYSLYSLLRTVQDQYNLPSLQRHDQRATPVNTSNFREGKYVNMHRIKIIIASVVGAVGALTVLAVVAFVVYRKKQQQRFGTTKSTASTTSLPVSKLFGSFSSRANKLKHSDFEVLPTSEAV